MSGKGYGAHDGYWTTPRILKFVGVWTAVALLTIAVTKCAMAAEITIRGVTLDCQFVRSLSWLERKLYIVRYEITKAEQRVIRQTCKLK